MTTVLDMGFKRITTNSREYGQDAAHDKLAFEGVEEVLIKEPGYVYIYLTCLPEPLGRMSINYSPEQA
jgi:hypothetical protein